MPFTFHRLQIPEVILISHTIFRDERGYFEETYKESDFSRSGIANRFVQDNHSFSSKGTLRGLHFQRPPHAQGKLVRCIHGKILDVAVDIRNDSPTFGKWVAEELSGLNTKILWIPVGFAHGFLAVEDSHVEYKVTREYSKESEDGIIWNDEEIAIDWQFSDPIVSNKDSGWNKLNSKKIPFEYVQESE